MTTLIQPIETTRIPEANGSHTTRVVRLFAGWRNAMLRRVRVAAWRMLDLETEFEALD